VRSGGRPLAWLWRRYARTYDALEGLVGYREMLDAVVELVGDVQGKCVVEVGCGTGNVLTRLLERRPATLTGVDASPDMLAPARGKLARSETDLTVGLVIADAVVGLSALPARSVDVLVVSNVLYALPDRSSFWDQVARVLVPGGRLVISNPDRPGFLPVIRQQWRERGPRGFADLRLLEVFVLNVVIDLVAKTGRYEFLSWENLATEAAESGLPVAALHGRCYGGTEDGINVLGVLSKV
jgi:ubiquinone/menaquinone biosynthesis C-methylase UbiE